MTSQSGAGIDHVVLATHSLDRAAAALEQLGFCLTPRASHPDHMGTSNRLAQFSERNFIELVEVDRPEGALDHDHSVFPPHFSFGAHNRDFLQISEGLSMLVLASRNRDHDLNRFASAGLKTYAPFDFERTATLPDGRQVRVGFRLGYVTSPSLPGLGFFVCENRFPENFWKAQYQVHANGAVAIRAVYFRAPRPRDHVAFLSAFTAGKADAVCGGYRISAGDAGAIFVLTHERIAELFPEVEVHQSDGPAMVGLAIASDRAQAAAPRPSTYNGAFIAWVAP